MAENEKLDLILSKLGQMDQRLDRMDERFDKLENDVTGIKLTLENEIRQNIMHVAEVNLDLLRKLDDSQEIDSEKRMLTIHVSILETELRKVKDRLEQIA